MRYLVIILLLTSPTWLEAVQLENDRFQVDLPLGQSVRVTERACLIHQNNEPGIK
jgi:hypothetical protein